MKVMTFRIRDIVNLVKINESMTLTNGRYVETKEVDGDLKVIGQLVVSPNAFICGTVEQHKPFEDKIMSSER